jgi:hypothetical protein
MDAAVLVRFTPDAQKDYSCDVVIKTERETFLLPVRAIGTRGMANPLCFL